MDPFRTFLDCQKLFPSTCSSSLTFVFFPSAFIRRYVSARPFIHLSAFLGPPPPFPPSPVNPALFFVSPLLANSSPITRNSAEWRDDDDAWPTPMSISSDLSYQPSTRLGRKIMNSSFAAPPCGPPQSTALPSCRRFATHYLYFLSHGEVNVPTREPQ